MDVPQNDGACRPYFNLPGPELDILHAEFYIGPEPVPARIGLWCPLETSEAGGVRAQTRGRYGKT